jgi:hypothetical protein
MMNMVGIQSEFSASLQNSQNELKDGICKFLHYERIFVNQNNNSTLFSNSDSSSRKNSFSSSSNS